MKCTFIGSGSDEVRYSFRDTKSHQVIRSRDITFVDSIYEARAYVGAQIRVRGPKIVGASRIVDDQIKKTLKIEHSLRMEASRLPGYEDPPESRAPVRYFPSANYLLLTENGEPESYSEALSSKEYVQ
nr:hypothetical protein [Tanacetum cinerariifolium]